MKLRASIGLQGRFKIETQAPGEPRRLRAEFSNLITDLGMDEIGANPIYQANQYCSVGTGAGVPDPASPQLSNRLFTTNQVSSQASGNSGASPYFGWTRKQFQFDPNEAAGNLTEVGVGSVAAGNDLFSVQQIVDGAGDPTPITVLPTETLFVTYELRNYVNEADNTYQLVVDSVSRDIVVRAQQAATETIWRWDGGYIEIDKQAGGSGRNPRGYTGAIGLITGSPSGTAEFFNSTVLDPYSAGSHKRTGRVVVPLDSTIANGVGVQCLSWHSTIGAFQVSILPVLVKTSLQEIWFDVELSWARYTPP